MSVLQISELKNLFDVSQHKKDEVIATSIEAIEIAYIKKYFGDGIYVYILENLNNSPVDGFVNTILNGGIYETSDGSKKYFSGLIKAISALVYCDLLIKQTIVTRYGAVNKNDQYSNKPEFSAILEQVSRYRKTAVLYIEDTDYFIRNCDATDYSDEAKTLILEFSETCHNKPEQLLSEWI